MGEKHQRVANSAAFSDISRHMIEYPIRVFFAKIRRYGLRGKLLRLLEGVIKTGELSMSL